MDEIRTERLVLRPVALDDLDDYAAMFANPEVMRFIGDGTTATLEESREWVSTSVERNARLGWDMRTLRRTDGTFVGRCGIAIRDLDHGTEHEIAYALARGHWGSGYATEAASAVRDHALAGGRRRLISLVAHDNAASARVATKVGMVPERDVEFHGWTCTMFALER
ncbi:MAG TPA: GNAT family N-acetyltransferase [Actinomycetota bacterium]|nr:GNAT family N-acetyltransferase [Actinomycetota bacterium]